MQEIKEVKCEVNRIISYYRYSISNFSALTMFYLELLKDGLLLIRCYCK